MKADSGVTQFSRLNLGVRGGLNLAESNADIDVLKSELESELGVEFTSLDRSLLPRFSAGAFIEYDISEKFAVQLNLLYNQKGEKYLTTIVEDFEGFLSTGLIGITDIEVINTYDYLSVPVFIKMKFFKSDAKPYIIAGPEFSYLISANQKTDLDIMIIDLDTTLANQSIKDDIQSIEWAFNFGAGLEFPVSSYKGFIEGRYGLGLTFFNKEGEENTKNNVVYLNIGVRF
jgi:hypothetical protein